MTTVSGTGLFNPRLSQDSLDSIEHQEVFVQEVGQLPGELGLLRVRVSSTPRSTAFFGAALGLMSSAIEVAQGRQFETFRGIRSEPATNAGDMVLLGEEHVLVTSLRYGVSKRCCTRTDREMNNGLPDLR